MLTVLLVKGITAIIVTAIPPPPSPARANINNAVYPLGSVTHNSCCVFIITRDFNQPEDSNGTLLSAWGVCKQGMEHTKMSFYKHQRGFQSSLETRETSLVPAYRCWLTKIKLSGKQIKTWPEGAASALWDSSEFTDWKVFRQAATVNQHIHADEYAEVATGYITKCLPDVTVIKNIATQAPHTHTPWPLKQNYEVVVVGKLLLWKGTPIHESHIISSLWWPSCKGIWLFFLSKIILSSGHVTHLGYLCTHIHYSR